MVLADLGASVVRIERLPGRAGAPDDPAAADLLGRGKRSIAVDLKQPAGRAVAVDLIKAADVTVEGFRPEVMERLGLGPQACLAENPRLIFGRVTGWGRDGPLAARAGHDINYIGLTGVLSALGRRGEPPAVPLAVVGDFAGGGLMLAMGICAALVERSRSGNGQVVDAAITDGAALLMTLVHLLRAGGLWNDERGTNLFDTGAPFYDVYETADGRYVSVGAIEPQFYEQLVNGLGPVARELPEQYDRSQWPAAKQRMAQIFLRRTQAEWCATFAGTDACLTPVLSTDEAPAHPHNATRHSYVDVGGITQPAPAPRFGRTPCAVPDPAPPPGADTEAVLAETGRSLDDIGRLRSAGVIA
jgi:alpha-methylacyl-CoA racemase